MVLGRERRVCELLHVFYLKIDQRREESWNALHPRAIGAGASQTDVAVAFEYEATR
jgi:hypothetical protein